MSVTAKPWEMVLIDFDGVISANIVSVMLKASHKFMNQYVPLPFEVAKSGMKSSVCMPMEASLNLSFGVHGLEEKIPEFFQVMMNVESYVGEKIAIRPDFFRFIDYLEVQNIDYRIFSAADKRAPHVQQVISQLNKADIFFPLEGRSKQSLKTYPEVARELGVDLNNCLMVDDACQALAVAQKFGITTVMMANELFTEADFELWQPHIAHMAHSFEELKPLLELRPLKAQANV